jgi:hypothetical protein
MTHSREWTPNRDALRVHERRRLPRSALYHLAPQADQRRVLECPNGGRELNQGARPLHNLSRRSSNRMDAKIEHAVLIAFHRFQRGSKLLRSRWRSASLIAPGSNF